MADGWGMAGGMAGWADRWRARGPLLGFPHSVPHYHISHNPLTLNATNYPQSFIFGSNVLYTLWIHLSISVVYISTQRCYRYSDSRMSWEVLCTTTRNRNSIFPSVPMSGSELLRTWALRPNTLLVVLQSSLPVTSRPSPSSVCMIFKVHSGSTWVTQRVK